MNTTVAVPPDLYHRTLFALHGSGKMATPEQVVDFLVALGVGVLERHPDLIGHLDHSLIEKPWLEHSTISVPAARSGALKTLAASATTTLGRPVGRAGAVRLAVAAGATALGHLPFAS